MSGVEEDAALAVVERWRAQREHRRRQRQERWDDHVRRHYPDRVGHAAYGTVPDGWCGQADCRTYVPHRH